VIHADTALSITTMVAAYWKQLTDNGLRFVSG
jgi:hypothetical protein